MNVRMEERFHVPSDSYPGVGSVHLHVMEPFVRGRLRRVAGETLCSKRHGSCERPVTDSGRMVRCERCAEAAKRYRIAWPSEQRGEIAGMTVVADERMPGDRVAVVADGEVQAVAVNVAPWTNRAARERMAALEAAGPYVHWGKR